MRDWFDQTTRVAAARPTAAWMATILLCVAYESFMVARLVFAGQPVEGTAYTLTRSALGALLVVAVAIGSAAALSLSPRWPLPTAAGLSALMLVAASVGMHNYATFPFLLSIYWVAAVSPLRPTVAAVACAMAVMVAASALAAPDAVWAEILGEWSVLLVTLLVAAVSRTVAGWRIARDTALREHEQLKVASRERDEARLRARVAGELHDSVGHNLTAIIALSEGLTGATGDDELDEAIAGINTLARDGLGETRRAVHTLTDPTMAGSPGQSAHSWHDLESLIVPVRRLGVPVVVTETGPRPDRPALADRSFTIVREAVTNAVRHNPSGLTSLAIALDHQPRVTRIDIRSTGSGPAQASADGTGLARLEQRVTSAGGTFHAGPDTSPNSWLVTAALPHPEDE